MKSLLMCLLLVVLATAAPSGKPRFVRGRNMIIGGTDVAPGEIPYQISFQINDFGTNFHFCGGSVYSEEWMITAGHCVAGLDFENPDNLRIVAGDNDLSTEEETEQAVAVIRIIQHQDYNSSTHENDIALLQIKSALTFGDYVQGVTLPEQMKDSVGTASVSGWGISSWDGSTSDILQVVSVPIVSKADCKYSYGQSRILDSMICAGAGGLDSCQGDSGGPLTCKSGDSTYLCGIVSWGFSCARPGYPGVYTKVSYFVDWIETNSGTQNIFFNKV